jgi:MtN3 and saliva related transmembrane protein
MLADVLGFLGAGGTTLSFVPQVLKVWKSRSARDISSGMYLLFIAGLVFWLAYGVMIGSWPILIANILTIGLAGSVLCMKWYFERGSP